MVLLIESFIATTKDMTKAEQMKRALRNYRRGIFTLEELKHIFEEIKRR